MLTQEQLKELLHYDPETGFFTWLKIGTGRKLNGVAGGKENRGYLRIRIGGKKYQAHRLAWLYVHGEWPPEQIDHINRVRDDNRIVNLRCVTNTENGQNRSDNTSGVPGVSWFKRDSKWNAQIVVNGKRKNLGCFADKQDAANARKAAELKYWSE